MHVRNLKEDYIGARTEVACFYKLFNFSLFFVLSNVENVIELLTHWLRLGMRKEIELISSYTF